MLIADASIKGFSELVQRGKKGLMRNYAMLFSCTRWQCAFARVNKGNANIPSLCSYLFTLFPCSLLSYEFLSLLSTPFHYFIGSRKVRFAAGGFVSTSLSRAEEQSLSRRLLESDSVVLKIIIIKKQKQQSICG